MFLSAVLIAFLDAINAQINGLVKTSSGSGTTGTYGEVQTSVLQTKKLICVDMNDSNIYAIPYHGSHNLWSIQVFNIVLGVLSNETVSWTAYYID